MIIFRDVRHSVSHTELLHHCQKSIDDPILLLSLYVIQSDVSPNTFTHFMGILSGRKRHLSPETSDDLMLLVREFGHNNLITGLLPQREVPRREGNVHEFFQELYRSPRGTTIKVEFQSIRDGFVGVQCRLSMIEEQFDDKLETIPSELEKVTKLVK